MTHAPDSIRVRLAAFVGGLVIAAVATTAAQQPAAPAGGQGRGGTPPAPQNLQILPKDIPRQELIGTMRGFTAALQVQCNYCHVQEGQGGRNDMASDEKAPKKVARVMMQMTAHDNEMIEKGVVGKAAADVAKVTCATCHRGEAIPKTPTLTPPAPPAAPPRF